MRALITGATGFVGTHLSKLLIEKGYKVWGLSRSRAYNDNVTIVKDDLSNEESLIQLINEIKPTHIYHLSGQSSVRKSWDFKKDTFQINVFQTMNLLEAVRKSKVSDSVKVLTVGSSEEYGSISSEEPIHEDNICKPISPYGISKACCSMLSMQYNKVYGLNTFHVRPFNHIGPGQSQGFVVTDFAVQIVAIEKGLQEAVLRVGNLSSFRDFTDVRDIVKAYHILMESKESKYGETYNVCSGNPVQIQELLTILLSLSTKKIEIVYDENRMRPSDIPFFVGRKEKISSLGWDNTIPLSSTLNDVLNSIRNIL
ncbi:NAD-dependent epimerase/dehydratase family protein [Paenibacillus dendritiformis]|uniref:GDP-mannose 4,6-dehydratase n=1 Tax=Paenibacillus dendritiformis TaxID=130049 RepID=UPI00105A0512|nr:GDP-mannose 4,6-dehydratase [Paenibacillus dendritiformis]TDL51860.1 NAD-dependent epimerase/dehydratase family protein [Paenibacillus dendritiformis]